MKEYFNTSGIECNELGVRILITKTLTEEEQNVVNGYCDKIYRGLLKIADRDDPIRIKIHEGIVERLCNCFDIPIYHEEIPNEYNDDQHSPWLIITTKLGHFKIGWRYRVIVIDWSKTNVKGTANELFPKEDVTKYDQAIHAWGYDKAKQYLERLHHNA